MVGGHTEVVISLPTNIPVGGRGNHLSPQIYSVVSGLEAGETRKFCVRDNGFFASVWTKNVLLRRRVWPSSNEFQSILERV